MQKFVRGNNIVCSGTFTPASGSSAPTSAVAILTYKDATTGLATSSTVSLTLSSGVWSGTWNSLLSQEGIVEWRIQASGVLQAAAQGQFLLQANDANVKALDP